METATGENRPTALPSVRVFFALWPGADEAEALHRVAVAGTERFGGRAMRRDTLHLTLAFIGDVAENRLPALLAVADGVEAPAGSIDFDRIDYWRHNRLLWAGCTRTPVVLSQLVESLHQRLGEAGFTLDSRLFVPHVTLARNMPPPDGDFLAAWSTKPVAWAYDEFSLVRSRRLSAGATYEKLHSRLLSKSLT